MTLPSRIPLDSLTPASVRWVQENQDKHVCRCGCETPIRPVELPEAGRIVEIPEVGGLHHCYVRQAA